jgi:hypothetical protein
VPTSTHLLQLTMAAKLTSISQRQTQRGSASHHQ